MDHSRSSYTRQQLGAWLEAVAAEMTLYAPRQVEGVLLYRPVVEAEHLLWDFTRPVLPAKELFFPPSEGLLSIEKTGQQIRLAENLPEGRQAVFGVRPCEARAIRLLDAVFLENPPADPCYARRRENTALIGLACSQPGETCFCTSVGGAPDDGRDVDVMLYPAGEAYELEVLSEKGAALIAGRLKARAGRSVSGSQPAARPPAPSPVVIPVPELASWPARFSDPEWERLAGRCLSCRLCAYLCPTCRCFDVRDEPLNGRDGKALFERIRCWDSCSGAAYRRIAGGHNPRAGKGQRLRNRLFCKFYYFPLQYGLNSPACTGCGRCLEYCPVGMDITEILSQAAG